MNRTISHILEIIYKTPESFFKEKDENNNLLPFPERTDLRKFMYDVILNYNVFHTQIGTYKQRSGLAMGSPLSSSMSDIFLSLMETTLIQKFIKNKEIIHWSRYVDDVIVICDKNSINNILEKINGYDHRLEFTIERMKNNTLKFLNMEIFIEKSKIKFRKVFKKDLNTVFTNYTESVSPQRYKNSAIYTQLHRVRDCSSDREQFSKSLNELRIIYTRNNYPSWLVERKIKSFSENFEKTPRPENAHTFVLDYNSPIVEYHAQKLINKIKSFAPDFAINSCYRSIKVSQLYGYTFKPCQDLFSTSNAVYKFTCSCNSLYIGQTKRELFHREHQQASYAPQKFPFHGIYHHITNCVCYKSNLKDYLENYENLAGPLKITKFQMKNEFYRTHFKKVQKTFEQPRKGYNQKHII